MIFGYTLKCQWIKDTKLVIEPVLTLVTAATRRGIDATNLQKFSTSMDCQIWSIHDLEVRKMLIKPGSNHSKPVRRAVVGLEYSISMWMAGRHIWMEAIAQQLYVPNCIMGGWYKHQRSQNLSKESTPDHDWTSMLLYSCNLAAGFMVSWVWCHILSLSSSLSSRNRN